ncbi:hypothetical protein IKS57_04570 [bacterium]|nr:hypothetical protein [bacterium]
MYRLKLEFAKQLRNKYIVQELGFSDVYVSQLMNGKRVIPKHCAYAIAKLYDKEIKDLFEKVGD